MNIPALLAKAFTNAPAMRMTEPIASATFLPHLELMAELIYGVTIAARGRRLSLSLSGRIVRASYEEKDWPR